MTRRNSLFGIFAGYEPEYEEIQPKTEAMKILGSHQTPNTTSYIQEHLPEEVLLHLFSFFDARLLCISRQLCKSCKVVAEEASLWKNLFKRVFPNSLFSSIGSPMAQYVTEHSLARNWRSGKYSYRLLQTSKPFQSMLFVDGNKMIAEGQNGSIQTFDLNTGKLLQEVEGHAGCDGILDFIDNGDLFFSYATYGAGAQLKVWDKETITERYSLEATRFYIVESDRILLQEFVSFTSPLQLAIAAYNKQDGARLFQIDEEGNFAVDEQHLYVYHPDGTVAVRDKYDGKSIKELPLEKEGCKGAHLICFCVQRDYLVLHFDNRSLSVWNKYSGIFIYKLEDISHFTMTSEEMISISTNGVISIWNLAEGSLRKTLDGVHFGAKVLIHERGFLISHGQGKTKIWDKATGSFLFEIEERNAPILSNNRLIYPSSDREIHIYDFSP